MVEQALPVVLCGEQSTLINAVIEASKPEYEVIHAVTSSAQGLRELPSILNGDSPSRPTGEEVQLFGTQDFSRPPVAILTGSAYSSDSIDAMRAACQGCSHGVPWLCHGADPEDGSKVSDPEYGPTVVKRMKAKLRELRDEDRMNVDGVYFY